MVLSEAVRSRVVSGLQPWLREVPTVDLKLGFLKSVGSIRNLMLDTSALDSLIRDATRLAFKSVKVDELSFQLCPWSSTTVAVEVRGFRVVLAPRELEDDSRCVPVEDSLQKELKDVLAMMDPEGVLIHDIIKDTLSTASSSYRFSNALTSALLQHIEIHFVDAHLQLDMIEESYMCTMKANRISLEPQHRGGSCLIGGFIASLFVPRKDEFLRITCGSLNLGLMENDNDSCLLSSSDVSACIRLNSLQMLGFGICIPRVDVTFCPAQAPTLYVVLGLLSPRECKAVRSGKELWRRAATYVNSLHFPSQISLYRLFNNALMWIRYVHTYELLLSSVGYCGARFFDQYSGGVPNPRKCQKLAYMADETEKKLLPHSVARARIVARRRVSLRSDHHNAKATYSLLIFYLWKIFALFSILWDSVYYVFGITVSAYHALNLHHRTEVPSLFSVVASIGPPFHNFFIVNVEELCITLCPSRVTKNCSNRKENTDGSPPYLDLVSFHILIKTLCFFRAKEKIAESLYLVLGEFQVQSSLPSNSSRMRSYLGPGTVLHQKRSPKSGDAQTETILHSEPALLNPSKELTDDDTRISSIACFLFLRKCLGELQTNWMMICEKLNVKSFQYMDNPFLLFGWKRSLVDPDNVSSGYGILKCCITVGKVNFVLDYSSIMFISLLLAEVQQSFNYIKRCCAPLISSTTPKKPPLNLEENLVFYYNEMNSMLLDIIPDRKLQIAVLIAGASIKLSSGGEWPWQNTRIARSDTASESLKNFCFLVHLDRIIFAIWPASRDNLLDSSEDLEDSEQAPNYLWLEEPPVVDILQAHSSETFSSSKWVTQNVFWCMMGLSASLKNLEDSQLSPIFGPLSAIIRCSTCRDYLFSFFSTTDASSAALRGLLLHTAVFLYTADLCALFQELEHIYTLLSSYINNVSFTDVPFPQETLRRFMMSDKKAIARIDYDQYNSMPLERRNFILDAYIDLESLDIISSNLRNLKQMRNTDASSSSYVFDQNSSTADLPKVGIGIFAKKPSVHLLCEKGYVKVFIGLCGLESIIFNQHNKDLQADLSKIMTPENQSFDLLYRLSLSTCRSELYACLSGTSSLLTNVRGMGDVTAEMSAARKGSDTDFHIPTDRMVKEILLSSDKNFWLMVDIGFGEVILAEYHRNNLPIASRQSNKLNMFLSITRNPYVIRFDTKGGCVYMETSALAAFIQCLRAYSLCAARLLMSLRNLPEQLEEDPYSVDAGDGTTSGSNYSGGDVGATSSHELSLLALTVDTSQFSITFAVSDKAGGIRELILEADAKLNLKNMGGKLEFVLSRLTIFSRHLQEIGRDKTMAGRIPHFHANKSGDVPSFVSSKSERPLIEIEDAHDGPILHSQDEIPSMNDLSQFRSSDSNCYILKHLNSSVTLEKTEILVGPIRDYWVGSCSISGFELGITLSEIQMLLDLGAPLSEIPSRQASRSLNPSSGPITEQVEESPNDSIPDGAIVAIQDVQQHMYFAVESVGRKYSLVGVLHYSLVGEKALFRVKYQNEKQWRMSPHLQQFVLMSLHARNDQGEALCLAFRPGSGFVEISNYDKKTSFWEASSYHPGSHDKYDNLRSFDVSAGKAFYLVNSKSRCAVSFVDGLPKLVKKPGNPFKVKVIHESDLVNSSTTGLIFSVSHDSRISEADLYGSSLTSPRTSQQDATLQQLKISIDKISLTIFHEVSNENDKFSLIRGHVNAFHFTGQIFPSKIRLIGTFRFKSACFDGQRNLWREMISPVDISLFFRSRFESLGSDNSQKKVPIHFYFSTRQIDVSLSDLSLDILLYSFWKLNILSPYAVRRSVIFSNLCKVENNLRLSLLCNFANNQEAILSGKQSTSILLRLGDDAHSMLSLRLTNHSSFSTSPIEIPLLKPFLLAWRTRVISLEDSRAFPGPFLVVEVSKKAEDGLAVVLSPLLRIHNESGFSVNLRFRRQNEIESESASVFLRHGDTIDDSTAVFDALNYSGGLKKALMSLGLGNFLLSLKPEVSENTEETTMEWSEDLKGEKAVRVSGIFDKLSYRFRKAFGVESVKSFFSTISCPLIVDGVRAHDLYFLIQTIGREVPVLPPEKMGDASQSKSSPVAVQLQKEIFILPTIQVSNFLQTDIAVALSGECHSDRDITDGRRNFGRHAMIACGSSALFYVNPATLYFSVTLSASNSTCKSVNSSDWLNKLSKQRKEVNYIDVDLDFGEKQFALLRLSRGERGILKATVYTNYTLENNTEVSILCTAYSGKQTMRKDDIRCNSTFPPELGLVLPPKSSRSWLLKSNKLQLTWLEEKASEALLDLDILSGFTEMALAAQKKAGIRIAMKLGVSLTPYIPKLLLPSQIVRLVPRYIISNESNLVINVRQCNVEDDINWISTIEGNRRAVLYMQTNVSRKRETSFFDAMFRKHRNEAENYMDFVQFHLEGTELSWSGPICIASLGRFFLKFKKTGLSSSTVLNPSAEYETESSKFAGVHIVEENSTLVLHFHIPPKFVVPYRIKNCLRNAAISFYQKESEGPETLESGRSVEYVWDDLNLPHKLVVQIAGINILREINIDKVRSWKSFLKTRQTRSLLFSFPKLGIQNKYVEPHGFDVINLGYEVLTDGLTRVLRICEFVDSSKEEKTLAPRANIKLRFASLAINLLEETDQDDNSNELQTHSTLLVARFVNIAIDSAITDKSQYNYLRIQSVTVDEKWQGAPFASMLRKDPLNDSDTDSNMLCFVLYITSTNSSVSHVKYSSVVLQPVDLNLDEETLMRLLKFWKPSISESETSSKMFYFEHFEIHPIKIRASFLPGNQYSSYNSVQETVRSFMHNVIKIPTINNTSVELNGVLLTHALVTTRELGIKCAKHYSWYLVRAVYIAKGSPLLPPAFASIFDDSASSSLDVFFDPSDGSINLPGVTLGMFKFIKTCISSKGFSGTKRYFGDLGKTVKRAGSNALFVAITEISDSILLGAESGGFSGMVSGFHQGILKLAMEPLMIGAAVMEGGPDRRINLDRSPGVDEVYIEGYLQALLDVKYKQEYLRVRVNDNQVLLKNLPPNSSLINEITGEVKSFLISKALLKGEASTARSIRQLRGESEWKLGPTLLTLCEHLFVSFAIRMLRKQTKKVIVGVRLRVKNDVGRDSPSSGKSQAEKVSSVWTVGRFALSGLVAYVDGRLCRHIPNPIARRIVSGFLLSFLEKKDGE